MLLIGGVLSQRLCQLLPDRAEDCTGSDFLSDAAENFLSSKTLRHAGFLNLENFQPLARFKVRKLQ